MGRAVRLDKMGVEKWHALGCWRYFGIVGAGVSERRSEITQGNDTVRLAVLTLVKFAKPRACACSGNS